jgi:hypothetical protein
MESRNKIRLGALLAAIVVTAGLAASLGPVANGIDHLLHHWFALLSPKGQAIAIAVGRSLPYWLPCIPIALLAGIASRRSQRRKDTHGVSSRRERRQIARPS